MKKLLSIFLLIFSIVHCPLSINSQVRPVYDYGAIGLGQLLKKLNTTKSVMMIGAHPDDEDSALLAYLARGENARTAYLSLTRGDGGQNIIGSELFESLGVIRTEELLQARRLDGAEQYFTRAFDYGFSKTLAEAKQKWDEKIILCDTVRAIRQFRPLVVISRFSGTSADGHGQHQFSGYISPLAVKAASDSEQCKDAGQAWQVQKFYVGQGFRSTQEPTLKINTGKYDPLIGRSYFEIAMEGRSQHKTQEQGVLELKGDQFSGLNLVESSVSETQNENSIFDGIDTSISAIKTLFQASELSEKYLVQARNNTFSAQSRCNENSNASLCLPLLAQALSEIRFAKEEARKLSVSTDGTAAQQSIIGERESYRSVFEYLEIKEREFTEAIKLAAGIRIDTLADTETIVAGGDFSANVKVFFPNAKVIKIKEINLKTPNGWTINKTEEPKTGSQNFRRETANEVAFFSVKTSDSANLTEPYWLKKTRDSGLFRWEKDENQNLPFQTPLASAAVKIEIAEKAEITLDQPLEYRFADDIRGEVRRELNIVPALSVSLDQNLLIVSNSKKEQTQKITLSVKNNSSTAKGGSAELILPENWRVKQTFGSFQINKKGENSSFNFDVIIPPNTKNGTYKIGAVARIGEETFNQTMNTIAYPHIQTHRFYTTAETKVEVLNLKTAPIKIGYIAGSGDRVFDAIRQMNFDAEILTENDLTNGDLSKYDTIVVGIRASQVRPDFIANHQRLLDYVKNGGTLLVQYQLPVYQSLLPFPAQMNARVTDENAKITILDPANPVFNFPNKITEEDFSGWVQERNLYAFSTFDANYKQLLESHDGNEAENKGGLVVAEIGKGKYIYCSYAFFRQLPAGVPGAYRLFANLLSQPKSGGRKR